MWEATGSHEEQCSPKNNVIKGLVRTLLCWQLAPQKAGDNTAREEQLQPARWEPTLRSKTCLHTPTNSSRVLCRKPDGLRYFGAQQSNPPCMANGRDPASELDGQPSRVHGSHAHTSGLMTDTRGG